MWPSKTLVSSLILATYFVGSSLSGNCPAAAPGDAMLAKYFHEETRSLQQQSLSEIQSVDHWTNKRSTYREQLQEMLGLSPLPSKTDLKPTMTGSTSRDGIVVERLYFQSRPGLYVTGNLYRPAQVSERLPAILYVCGHGRVTIDGVSYGNKVHYQHHGAWFARNGYICLTIDSIQLGEIAGVHHGTYRYDMWWWLNRGYTPAGVEAWNCIRALDYLETRSDVDPNRLGVTGRSGGGIYSWWLTALDDRIAATVPVAGITDLMNYVVDGVIEGHCDCMFMVNTYRWDYPHVAALVAPRPLLISNTDRDNIFPLDGVVRTHKVVKRIYSLHDAANQLALNISSGPHQDTQELRINAFRWLNHHLRQDETLIADVATKCFEADELKVFAELPSDERNHNVHEWFVAAAPPTKPPTTQSDWEQMRDAWKTALDQRVFRGWPQQPIPLNAECVFSRQDSQSTLSVYQFDSQNAVRLPVYVVQPNQTVDSKIVLQVLDESGWQSFLATYAKRLPQNLTTATENANSSDPIPNPERTTVYVVPRGIGPTAWDPNPKKQKQIRRRFYLLGQTRDTMRIWDLRRAIQLTHALKLSQEAPFIQADQEMAALALYAALYEPGVQHLDLSGLPNSHRAGPYLLNVQRFLELPQVLTMVAERCAVTLHDVDADLWRFSTDSQSNLQWPANRLKIQVR